MSQRLIRDKLRELGATCEERGVSAFDLQVETGLSKGSVYSNLRRLKSVRKVKCKEYYLEE